MFDGQIPNIALIGIVIGTLIVPAAVLALGLYNRQKFRTSILTGADTRLARSTLKLRDKLFDCEKAVAELEAENRKLSRERQ